MNEDASDDSNESLNLVLPTIGDLPLYLRRLLEDISEKKHKESKYKQEPTDRSQAEDYFDVFSTLKSSKSLMKGCTVPTLETNNHKSKSRSDSRK